MGFDNIKTEFKVYLIHVPYVIIKQCDHRLGNLLDFGQLFKAFGNNYFAQISQILKYFVKVSKSHFSSESIFG